MINITTNSRFNRTIINKLSNNSVENSMESLVGRAMENLAAPTVKDRVENSVKN